MGWVFQGNSDKFDIDDYLARFTELIYWSTPKYADQIAIDDRVFIWRSGTDGGAIGIGNVVELPKNISDVSNKDALGEDYWKVATPAEAEVKTGIKLLEVRLLESEGIVSRETVKATDVLRESLLIRMPNGTVFPLNEDETHEFERLWGIAPSNRALLSARESGRKLYSHYRRERSAWLKSKKIETVLAENDVLSCELCRTNGNPPYPSGLETKIFEIHHLKPLASADDTVETTLDDLAVLCANCHRAVHATKDVENNYQVLRKQFLDET